MRDSFHIKGLGGERKLKGAIRVGGAKNAILKSMPATLLFEDEVTISNVPAIEDVGRVVELLRSLGASVEERGEGTYTINTLRVANTVLDDEIGRRLRASLVFIGPLLARFGRVSFPHPGGDVIGPRPINLFLEAFEKMGCIVERAGERYHISTNGRLKGAEIFSMMVSVTLTETVMMAATLAEGTTILKNAAMEPEIVELANYLNACGARIAGAGTPTLRIEGGEMLRAKGAVCETVPDRIEAGSFLILGALAAKDLTITNCRPQHIEILIQLLKESGVHIEVTSDSIRVIPGNSIRRKPLNIKTHEYPGFATDLQAPMVVYLTQAEGESTVFETIFGGRLSYTEDLVRMGANITLWNSQQATIKGPTPLLGKKLESPDIRAGLAFLMAAAIAKGESVLDNVYHIDRGYAQIEKRLLEIGLSIKRISAN
ncbi:UDP-N-acetylglucosamine 1-carboxyvinyltransferase [Candidatus Kaiserbacteria bacterium RIFCSPHIGHO2_01_FULL_49_13]|uniref:UDP-N-acetylglucosamine 1-carboxyvinyltransferase n=1 Tax=Candidatus Kaiserbacteria bacterium RIFCSPHIGHO2_01_FULL_49_13 TaxID=1798477 RepID=A0A1F6CCS2_9BACT|nr:MAG: UDP-N-acetylglucosamine 1-carboxyvinyltransferase [Candidatus Kaiserbacteria bacterium RIFCSPHIGHO2_01_FULL_49_13]